ncbi:MAG TPA: ornithine cyclodeaminase family protein [Thermodesulfobacteriota bacterium]|nr:ornithine cyclodeaminase family protein [Thermodesulfobacteriota bacterium]
METDGRAAGTPLWITEADVVSLVDLADAIAALEEGLRLEARGEAENLVKTHVEWGGGHTLHAIGAVFPGAGLAGTKTWAHTAGGATPLLVLFDSHTGRLKAIVEAFALGQLRTGAASGVATKWLAAEDAQELAIIGTGKQALTQVAAVAAVRRLARVRVFSPTPEHRRRFAERLRATFPFEVVEAASVAEAVRDAPIVTLVTRATAPFLAPEMVARGAHVNAVGAIVPSRAEFEPALLARCHTVAVDSLPQVRELSREFREYYGSGRGAWEAVTPLCRVVARGRPRPPEADVTLFKAMGMGISDLAVGREVYARALRAGAGRPIPHPEPAAPRLAPATRGSSS